MNAFRAACAAVLAAALAACGGGSSSSPPPPPPITVTSVTVAPGTLTLLAAHTRQLAATAHRSDGTSADVTAQATWLSSAPAKVAVAAGLVSAAGVAGDSATITATYSGVSGAASVSIVASRPAIGPALGNDPLALQEWHLVNTGQTGYADNTGVAGQDLQLANTYAAGYSGLGVKVGVVDSGLEIAHEDLAANVVPGSWNFLSKTSDPTSTAPDGDHGTSVAGIIGMVYDNGVGGMGVAPSASLNGYNYIVSSQTLCTFQVSMGMGAGTADCSGGAVGPTSNDVWIFNQSFGYGNTADFGLDPGVETTYASGATNLRGGLGAVYVKAAGNGFRILGNGATTTCPSGAVTTANCCAARAQGTACQNASMDPNNTTPYNIVVGALNAKGVRSSYSTAGSALWVSAPGGEFGLNASVFGAGAASWAYDPAMVTTDQSGCAKGYAQSTAGGGVSPNTSTFDNGGAPNASCNYVNTMNGTSSATPSTAGSVALLLDAAPTLGWRDVKHILASTARKVDAAIPPVVLASGTGTGQIPNGPYTAEAGWTQNAAGYWFHNWYGFGAVDVDGAVAMATSGTYANLPAQVVTSWIPSGSLSVAIPDYDATGGSSTLAVATGITFVEAVQIQFSATHPYEGDLGVELTSPSGTKSILLNVNNGFTGSNPVNFQLESNAFYGEAAAGNWSLKVVDGSSAHAGGTLTSWWIRIYGH